MFLKFSANKQAEWPDTLYISDDGGGLRVEAYTVDDTGRSKAVWGQTLTPTEADEIKKFIESRGWAL